MTAEIYAEIYLRNNNKYYVLIRYKDINGKNRTKWVSTGISSPCKSKRTLEKKRDEILNECKHKLGLIDDNVLFSDYLRKWLELTKHNLAETTYNNYKIVINGSICPYFEDRKIKLVNLKPIHIQEFYNERMESGISANTIYHYHANIHKALQYAVKTDRLNVNPADKVDLPKKQKHCADFYTADELNALISSSMGSKMETVVLLASWFGLRRGEILGLRWDCINFINKTLTIKGVIARTDKMFYKPSAKNQSSLRTFPMPDDAVVYLQELKDKQEKSRIRYGNLYNDEWDGFVCVDNRGKLLTLDYVSREFPKLCKNAGLRKIKLHELRHTNISLLMESGASIKELQAWAGHSCYSTTADIYAHLQARSNEKLALSINNIISLPTQKAL